MKDANWTLHIDTEKAKADTHEALRLAIEQTFELDIKPEAVKLSPYKTGTNRRSIDILVEDGPLGIVAQLFTQSGYGGYLELGTRYMKAMPFLYPAFNMFLSRLQEIIGRRVKAIKPGMFIGPEAAPEE